jgi:cysteine desulfurase / selenocysteine lyase
MLSLMPENIVYLDNAATSYPKPDVVYQAQDAYLRHAANPGRGAHRLSMDCARLVHEARLSLAGLLGISAPERLVFTPGCTASLNMVIKGLQLESGDAVVVSALEHNAVMRPLCQLQESLGVDVVVLPYAGKGIVDLHQLVEALLSVRPRLCVMTAASNVTGEACDLASVAAICAANRVPLLVDGAQAAGRTLGTAAVPGISFWCGAGHKGLLGAPGVGLLYVAEEMDLIPLIAGGTGSLSESLEMPAQYPDRLESGTLPGPAIVGLGAGVDWLASKGVERIVAYERNLTERFLTWARQNAFVRVFGSRAATSTAVVAFEMEGITCDRVAGLLDTEFGIAVRSGLHCAAAAHRALGTIDRGLVRVSFGCFNTNEQVDYLCDALSRIASHR